MKTRSSIFCAVWASLLILGLATPEANAVNYCPELTLRITKFEINGSQVEVCADYTEVPGSYQGQPFTFPYKRWYWEVKNVTAVPQEGQGACAVFTSSDPKASQVEFRLVCRTRLWPHCNAEYSIDAVPKVDMDHDLWWFNGEDPGGGYNITATLTVSPLTTGNFKWDVISGSDKVDLNNGGADADSITATDDNTVTVKSTAPSAAAASVTKDVAIQLTYNGAPVCTFDLAVFAPHSLNHLANIDHDYSALPPPYPDYTGYWCEIKYEILDQFDRVLPHDVPWNEDFNKDGSNPVSGISDYSGENWGWGLESGWPVPPNGAIDNLARPDQPGLIPAAQNVGSGSVKVDHVIGGWYIGSTTIGDGVLVMDNNKWQMYQDHGRHE